MLTIEFKCYPTPEQQEKIERWLNISNAVWNNGLAALEEFDKNYYWYKTTEGVNGKEPGNFAPICRIPWEYRPYWLNENGSINLEGKGDIKFFIFSRIYDDRSHWYIKELSRVKVPQASEKKQSWGWKNNEASMLTGYSCPIPCDWREPMLHRPGLQQPGGLGQVIKGENLTEKRGFIQEMPYKFRTGVLTGLDTSWQEFTKSRAGIQNGAVRGRPRFKRKRDKAQTIVHPNPKDVIEPKGKNILGGIPSLGSLKVKGLDRRWRNSDGSIPKVATFKLCKYPSGYYVQLTGDLQRSRRIKANSKAVGIDPGLDNYLTLSNGKKYGNPRFYRNAQATLAELQRELAAKLTHRLILWLNHPQRLHKEIREFINISPKKAEELCKVKTEAEGVALIGGLFWQRLKWNCLQPSKEQKKLEAKISKLHEKIRRQRGAFNHKISSEIVTNYEFISCENGLQSQNLKKEAKPQEDLEKGGYKKNGKARKSGLAKSLSDAGHGDVIAKIEQKSKRDERMFKRNPAAYTSQTCPVCCQKMSEMSDPKIKLYQCGCGWKRDRDVNAAINDELALLADLISKGKKKWSDLSLPQLQGEMPMQLSIGAKTAKIKRVELLSAGGTVAKKRKKRGDKA